MKAIASDDVYGRLFGKVYNGFFGGEPLEMRVVILLFAGMASLGVLACFVNFFTVAFIVAPIILLLLLASPWSSIIFLLGIRTAVDFLQGDTYETVQFNLAAAFAIAIILGVIVYFVVKRTWPRNLYLTPPFLLFIFSLLASTLFSHYEFNALKDILRSLSIFAIYVFIASHATSLKRIKTVLYTVVAAGLIPVFVGIAQIFTGAAETFKGFPRVQGTFTGPTGLAWETIMILPLIAVLAIYSRKKDASIGMVLFGLLSLVALVFTFTRIAWAAFLLEVFLLAFFRFRQLLFIGPLVLVMVFYLFYSPLSARILEPQGVGMNSEFVTDIEIGGQTYEIRDARVHIWQENLRYVFENPLFGSGVGSFPYLSSSTVRMAAHNDYLRLIVETGLFGFLSYVWLVARFFREGIATLKILKDRFLKDITLYVVVLFFALCVVSFFHSIIILPNLQWYVWALAALVPAMRKLDRGTATGEGERRLSPST